MPWYKAGTVSVAQNSSTVTGAGTSFIANSRVGDAFRGPDGGWYEVTNIASDTALSIAPNYQGANNSSGVYALAPMQGYVKQSADALRSLVNQFGGVLAVLGTDPTLVGVRSALNLADTGGLLEGTNKYYTDARVRGAVLTGLVTTDPSIVLATDALLGALGKLQAQATAAANAISSAVTAISGKAAKGANNDITELNALSKVLTVGQGGTGASSLAAFLTSLKTVGAYSKDSILGTVSQSSGVPTGAVIERGSSSSGDYVKFADGTLICTLNYDGSSMGITSAVGSFFQAGQEITWTYPAAFVSGSTPICMTSVNRNDGTVILGTYNRIVGNASMQWRLWSATSFAAGNVKNVQILAIGRWF